MNEFSQTNSLCSLDNVKIAEFLVEIGDDAAAERFIRQGPTGMGVTARILHRDQYAYSGVVLGFLPPVGEGSDPREIWSLDQVVADERLIDQPVKITVDQFFVESYPGLGKHRILCEFAGRNQTASEVEQVKFALTLASADRESAAVVGTPIFVGLRVGRNGISFEGRTVSVGSDVDDLILDALKGGAFQNGLALLTSAQPALKPFVGLATSVVAATVKRRKNQQVYAFQLGLDFSNNRSSARLRYGSYIVLQAPPGAWDWKKFSWDASSRTIVSRAGNQALALNYLVFGVSRFEGDVAKEAPRRPRAKLPNA